MRGRMAHPSVQIAADPPCPLPAVLRGSSVVGTSAVDNWVPGHTRPALVARREPGAWTAANTPKTPSFYVPGVGDWQPDQTAAVWARFAGRAGFGRLGFRLVSPRIPGNAMTRCAASRVLVLGSGVK